MNGWPDPAGKPQDGVAIGVICHGSNKEDSVSDARLRLSERLGIHTILHHGYTRSGRPIEKRIPLPFTTDQMAKAGLEDHLLDRLETAGRKRCVDTPQPRWSLGSVAEQKF